MHAFIFWLSFGYIYANGIHNNFTVGFYKHCEKKKSGAMQMIYMASKPQNTERAKKKCEKLQI